MMLHQSVYGERLLNNTDSSIHFLETESIWYEP